MPDDVHNLLREQLDQYSVGFPSTDSGVEMKILEKLFNEEEAEMFLNLSLSPETPEAVAERISLDSETVAALLERMAEKGLLFRLRKGASAHYSAIPFIVGIYEFQLKSMDRELAELVDRYFDEGFGLQMAEQTMPLRPIAVNRSIAVLRPVAPYEDTLEIVRSQKLIAVGDCICRKEKGFLGKACDKPLEACLSFGPQAQYYVDLGMARFITQEEAFEILECCEAAGLVPQPDNSQRPLAICNCCGDCCGVLTNIKRHPRPAELVVSNYYVELEEDLCCACEVCLDRCQMEAVAMGAEGVAVVSLDRCIGCGLCVTTCETGALSLRSKQEDRRREPPVKFADAMVNMAKKRGKSLIPIKMRKHP